MSSPQTFNCGSDLSSYEKLRLNNIKRNNAKLRELGLISKLEEQKSNLLAQGKSYIEDEGKNPGKNEKKRKRETKSISREGSRKSLRLRLQNLDADTETQSFTEIKVDEEDVEKERIARVVECREVRLRAAKAIAEAGAEKASKENPTASYEHCLMRVKTMTPKKLETRIRVIERAAGKFCVVKMAIFKSCLQDEGMWDLADLANAALERLKALKEAI